MAHIHWFSCWHCHAASWRPKVFVSVSTGLLSITRSKRPGGSRRRSTPLIGILLTTMWLRGSSRGTHRSSIPIGGAHRSRSSLWTGTTWTL